MHEIYVEGSGMIKDGDHLEIITFRAPIQTGNIVLEPEEEVIDGAMYPKFVVDEVRMDLDLQNTLITVHGDTPLFKTKNFEESLKTWL